MSRESPKKPIVRVAGILIEDSRILLVKQFVTPARGWSLPGGKLEFGETIEQCIKREMQEETGLKVSVKELLYITDRFFQDTHVVHMNLLVDRTGRKQKALSWKHSDPYPSGSAKRIREIKMVPIDELTTYGFTPTYCRIIKKGFPGRGAYKGDYGTFYGEQL